MWVEDYEPAMVWSEQWVRARKAHWCIECGRAIAVRERYHLTRSLFDGAWHTDRTCERCAKLRDELADKLHDGAWVAGLLWEEVWHLLPRELREALSTWTWLAQPPRGPSGDEWISLYERHRAAVELGLCLAGGAVRS